MEYWIKHQYSYSMAPTACFRWIFTDAASGLLTQTQEWCRAADVLAEHPDALPVPWSERFDVFAWEQEAGGRHAS